MGKGFYVENKGLYVEFNHKEYSIWMKNKIFPVALCAEAKEWRVLARTG